MKSLMKDVFPETTPSRRQNNNIDDNRIGYVDDS